MSVTREGSNGKLQEGQDASHSPFHVAKAAEKFCSAMMNLAHRYLLFSNSGKLCVRDIKK